MMILLVFVSIFAFIELLTILLLVSASGQLIKEVEAYERLLDNEIADCDSLMEDNFDMYLELEELKQKVESLEKPKKTRKPRTKKVEE